MRIRGVDVVPAAKATFKGFKEDDLQGEAAAVAYHFLFSVVPLLIFLTALSGFVSRMIGVNDMMDNITEWVRENLPEIEELTAQARSILQELQRAETQSQ